MQVPNQGQPTEATSSPPTGTSRFSCPHCNRQNTLPIQDTASTTSFRMISIDDFRFGVRTNSHILVVRSDTRTVTLDLSNNNSSQELAALADDD
ncbi:hypothetical protein CF319_g9444 [Tilletia indica]|uniref:Uncharacterized protein n=1 Tax=Tilletia indica TaxID=43049 RepID=A0A177T593_9BASI|nr:hypothetical protein CF319_g9444 [Tilletia indica]KAE8235179.1 hypothetical protein A4X13_0g9587 [Tilletia indica]